MSHFEFVSVALALMYALLAGRLLAGLSPSLEETRRYSIHAAWIIVLLLVTVMQWWVAWRMNQVVWTPIRFLWALALPAVVFVRAGVLLSDDPPSVLSFRSYFFEHRVPFFALGIASAAQATLTPWVLGITPWFAFAPIHPTAVVLVVISISGLVFRSHVAHAIIVAVAVLLALATFYLVPAVAPSA